ncbi:hypothetical protein ACE1TH_16045 [Shouchella sp. JSM 1781072]|uniref:hypothetical protein n=1 Tax=Shouchella sp. JSM 1781072 TaxID=3344581 RepID=UPI0035C11074
MCRSVHDFLENEVDFFAYAQQKGFVQPNDPQKIDWSNVFIPGQIKNGYLVDSEGEVVTGLKKR